MAGFAGNDARAGNAKDLSARLATIGSEKAGALTQQGNSALSLAQQMQSGYLSSQQSQADGLLKSYQQRQQNELDQAKLALDQQKADWSQMGAGTKGYTEAAKIFGTQGDTASKAINLIMQAGNANTGSAQAFVQSILDANKKNNAGLNNDQLAALAWSMYSSVKPATNSYLLQQGG
jgi:hypothetical protein